MRQQQSRSLRSEFTSQAARHTGHSLPSTGVRAALASAPRRPLGTAGPATLAFFDSSSASLRSRAASSRALIRARMSSTADRGAGPKTGAGASGSAAFFFSAWIFLHTARWPRSFQSLRWQSRSQYCVIPQGQLSFAFSPQTEQLARSARAFLRAFTSSYSFFFARQSWPSALDMG